MPPTFLFYHLIALLYNFLWIWTRPATCLLMIYASSESILICFLTTINLKPKFVSLKRDVPNPDIYSSRYRSGSISMPHAASGYIQKLYLRPGSLANNATGRIRSSINADGNKGTSRIRITMLGENLIRFLAKSRIPINFLSESIS